MNEIQQPTNIALVKPRDDGRGQGKAREDRPPPKKVVEAYQETSKSKPVDDRITILGIPAEQITPATQAALASLVAEINFLRGAVRRLESGAALVKREAPPVEGEMLPPDVLMAQLGRLVQAAPPPGVCRILVLAYLGTFEDVRRSSGLLAANTLLADVAQRFARAEFTPTAEAAEPAAALPLAPGRFKFRLAGFAGGSSLAGVAELPGEAVDETHISRQVRDHCLATGFNVAGIEMSVALAVAAVVISPNEGAVTALARADHLLRGGAY